MTMRKTLLAIGLAIGLSPAAFADGEQFIPMTSYRVGPYAAGGTGVFGGFIDYINLINARDGGVGGVKLTYSECETEYKTDRAVECYERLKGEGPSGASMFNFVATGPVYALLERSVTDKIPLVSIGYGRADAADGRVFPYVFPLMTTYWSQNTAKIRFIGSREGGMDKLKGKKIVNLYHDSAYGKETLPILEAQAKKYGFSLVSIPVPAPGNEQQAQWLQIRRERPDWVILRGWGIMNPTAIQQAARVGFPRDHMVGVWWAGAEEDVIPAGDAAKGYIAAGLNPAGDQFPAVQQIKELLYKTGKGNMNDPARVGSIYYNRGIVHGVLNVEAIKVAQDKFGHRPLSGEEVRWGLEHLNLTHERLKELGVDGLLPPMKTSCLDHEGQAPVIFSQWDGRKWNVISEHVDTDQALVRPLVEESAAKYAAEKGIKPRDCSQEM
ncbi:ABC transporter substrate-binding protein [Plasticicumulans acidivorans]|uniref:Amino acid/amide ABC transporter substrate-binding protein (HAAT family) n=1 Tax=Plasticicumulans acidivorans TaxID=886464 RepID=A0A317MXZ8_9GAMM|nr:ABC transporter substrate-binding protein [Plasticicumulans acidivorans]PWV60197.1 amino acid/amide ABC transporter substrate-binding protein (HAAT family) [Plasticicumulans acidivorans]